MGADGQWVANAVLAAYCTGGLVLIVYAVKRAPHSPWCKAAQSIACLASGLAAYYMIAPTLKDTLLLAFANWMIAGAYADARDIWRKARQPKNQDKDDGYPAQQ